MYVFVFQRKKDRIMGGYMKEIMPLDSNLNAVPVLLIGVASDVTDRIVPPGEARVVRIGALTDCRVWAYKETKEGDGLALPEGTIEYFGVPEGYALEIQGSANIME